MTRVVLIRHAESEMNFKFPHLIGGRSHHTPLTDTGILQAKKLGIRFRIENRHFDVVIASPAIRTMETLRITHDTWGFNPEIIIDDRVQELSHGDWEGLLRSAYHTKEVLAEIIALNGRHKAPNGESQVDVEERMVKFLQECVLKYPDKTIAVYTHSMVIKCFMRYVQDWDYRKTYGTAIDNTSLSIADYHHDLGEWHLKCLNDYAHLGMVQD